MNIQPDMPSGQSTIYQKRQNPLLAGIRLVSSEPEMLQLIARDPFRDADWRIENRDIDLFRVYLQQVVVPTKLAIRIGLAVHRAVKVSLHQQDPEKLTQRLQYFATGSTLAKSDYLTGVHEAMPLKGITGVGKSHLVKAALATLPQCVVRYDIPGLHSVVQIIWIYIDLSSISSVEALAERIIDEVDSVLGSNGKTREKTLKGTRSAGAKMTAALRLLKTHFCALLVLDEIQFENFATAAATPIRSWILRTCNLGIGLLISGNPMGFKLQLPRMPTDEERISTQLLRRLFSTDCVRIDPAPSADDPAWINFTRGIDRCRLAGSPHPSDEPIRLLKFEITGGFPDFYVQLHVELEKILLANPSQPVDEKLIRRAANNSTKLREMQPLISAFAHKDAIALRLCADVDYQYYQELWLKQSSSNIGNSPPGPVGIVAVPPSVADPAKTLESRKRAAAKRTKSKKSKKGKEMPAAAAAVRDALLDGLRKVITGTSDDSSDA